ncbi:MAG: tetratricopeptide repeat protein [Sphingobacteriales bacterium]
MKLNLIPLTLFCLLLSICAQSQDCPENINKLPMYGGVKKCKEQIEDDKEFLATCDKTGKSRRELSEHFVMRGWQYLRSGKPDTSMMRFNQAWLLDSLNVEAYWGFADLLGMQQKFKESIPFFERFLKANPHNARVLQDESTTYGNLFYQTKDKKYLEACITCLKNAAAIEPQNGQLYGLLTNAYSYYMQRDSARKYFKIAEKLNSTTVTPEVKKTLENR